MAEWHVSESESEPDVAPADAVELGGLKIPPSRLLEMFQTLEKRKTLRLDCLRDVRRKKREERKQHKKDTVHSPGNAKSHEDASETTASEIHSTTSTNECRDARRPSLSKFDYFHEDFPALTGHSHSAAKLKKRPPAPKDKKVASLDSIMANVKRHKRQEREEFLEHQQEEIERAKQLISPEYPHANNFSAETSLPCADVSNKLESPMEVEQRPLQINFGDDSDVESPNSEMDVNLSLLSQINRVEKILDAEGLT